MLSNRVNNILTTIQLIVYHKVPLDNDGDNTINKLV